MRNLINLFSILIITLFFAVPGLSANDLANALDESYKAETEKDYEKAYSIIEDIMEEVTDEFGLYTIQMRLGYLNNLLKKYKEAAENYNAAALLRPKAIEPMLYLQYQYLILQDWSKLIDVCIKALKLDPNNYTSKTRLAYSFYMTGNYEQSASEYLEVLSLYPLDIDVMNMIGWSYVFLGMKDEAKKIFKTVTTISPGNTSANEGLDYLKNLK
ncbi:MAG: tetratricopeptide repeat protein [Candidatus Hydrogenedentota bacterium]